MYKTTRAFTDSRLLLMTLPEYGYCTNVPSLRGYTYTSHITCLGRPEYESQSSDYHSPTSCRLPFYPGIGITQRVSCVFRPTTARRSLVLSLVFKLCVVLVLAEVVPVLQGCFVSNLILTKESNFDKE